MHDRTDAWERYMRFVDAGGTAADRLESMGLHRLRCVVVTHYHADHTNGLYELLARLPVDTLYMPDIEDEYGVRQRLEELAASLLTISEKELRGEVLTDEEYERMTSCQGTIRIDLEPGDNVRIKSGSVENAIGTVEEINAEEHKVKVSIEILNRKTTVEYDISEVERL